MTMHSVKIKMHAPGRGTVELDGKPVSACTAFECIGRVGEANVLKLTLLVKDVEIEGVYDVTTIDCPPEMDENSRRFEKLPDPPAPPENRIDATGFLTRYIGPKSGYAAWRAQPWWKRVLTSRTEHAFKG